MNIWILSDLHLEYADLRQPLHLLDADVCVMAGDLRRAPANGVHWLARHIAPSMLCVHVAGNHEFCKGPYGKESRTVSGPRKHSRTCIPGNTPSSSTGADDAAETARSL